MAAPRPYDENQYTLPQYGGGGTSGTGGDLYTNATPVPTALGGISAGMTFSNKTMKNMWDSLLYPYQAPAFSSLAITGESSAVEVGYTVPASRTFTWATTNSSNVAANSISIQDYTGGTTIATGLANDGSEATTSGAVQKTTAVSNTWRIAGTNSLGTAFTRDYTMSWRWRGYYGTSANAGPLVEADVEGLTTNALVTGYAATYSFSAGGYKYIAYPSSLGTATTFKDSSTNLDVPFESPYTVSVTNSNGVTTNYNVHRSTNIMGAALSIVVS